MSGPLFVSFWHVGLENLPEGQFAHRRVPLEEAQRLIEKAKRTGSLCGVSRDDLFAPHNERESRDHEALVNCHYVLASQRAEEDLRFEIDTESVTFHLFEALQP